MGAPFNSGVLATGATPDARFGNRPLEPAVLARVRGLEAACKEFGVELPAAALQFPLAHPMVVSVVAGLSSASEVTKNVALLQQTIPDGFWSALKYSGLLRHNAPVPNI